MVQNSEYTWARSPSVYEVCPAVITFCRIFAASQENMGRKDCRLHGYMPQVTSNKSEDFSSIKLTINKMVAKCNTGKK